MEKDLILPTEEQVERACDLIAKSVDRAWPEDIPYQELYVWRTSCRSTLVILLNKDKILGDRPVPDMAAWRQYPVDVYVGKPVVEDEGKASPCCLEAFDDGRAHERLMSQRKSQGDRTADQEVKAVVEPIIALADTHISALERAIRAEGYDITVDTKSGEVKLDRPSRKGFDFNKVCPFCKANIEGIQADGVHHCQVPTAASGGHTKVTYLLNGNGCIEVHQPINEVIPDANPDA